MESEYSVDTRTIIVKGNTKKIVFISEIEYLVKIMESFENMGNRVRERELSLEYGVNVLCIGCDHRINKTAEISFRLTPTYGCTNEGQDTHNIKMRRLQKEGIGRREIILIHNRTTSPKTLEILALRAIAQGRLDIKNVTKLKDKTGFVIPYKDVFPNLEYMLWQPLQGTLFAALHKSICKKLFLDAGHWKPLNTFSSGFFRIRKDEYPYLLLDNTIRSIINYLLNHPFSPYTTLLWIPNPLLDDETQSKHITRLPRLSTDTTSSEEDDTDDEVTQDAYSTSDDSDEEYPAITPDWDHYVGKSEESYPLMNSKIVESCILQEAQELRRQRTVKATEDDVEEEIEQLGKQLLDQHENEPGPSKPRVAKERYPGPNPYKDPQFRHIRESPPPPEYATSDDSD
jgi:hypothetical protein